MPWESPDDCPGVDVGRRWRCDVCQRLTFKPYRCTHDDCGADLADADPTLVRGPGSGSGAKPSGDAHDTDTNP